MAGWSQGFAGFDFGGSFRGSGGMYVTWQNGERVGAIMAEIEDGLKYQANKDLRQAAKAIARDVVIPQLKRAARSSPVPIARAMAETARPKADRIVTVQIGGVNPPLSGFKRGVGSKRAGKPKGGRLYGPTSRDYRTTLAWGSEFGPFPGAKVNHYKVSRREGGYWVHQGTQNAIPEAVRIYSDFLEELFLTRSRHR